MDRIHHNDSSGYDWTNLYKAGGLAALVAGVLFRRNLSAEIGLFSPRKAPVAVGDWFELLQSDRLLGLAYLNVFDLVNYILVLLMFVSLFVALRRDNRSSMAVATTLGIVGIAVYLASNTALSMLSLSDQYAVATVDAQRASLLGAGQAMLALNRFSNPGAHPGAAGYMSLLLIALAGLITSVIMLRGHTFNRVTAIAGILASALDLAYCAAYVLVAKTDTELLATLFIPAAGLFLMIWHIMVGWRLYQLGRLQGKALPESL
jgi:hypothetical protein